ncbi:MAG: hypothetical protein U5L76_05150 [Patescibacteria group bacterium]|nr:hypothetical protein [Patescibacteria group bacterium]
MNREREKGIDFEKQQRLFEIEKEVAEMEDNLGKEIDPGIRETLVSVKAHDLPTSQSCEGHNHRGEALPWIQIENPAPAGWEEDDNKKELWCRWNKRDADKLQILLDEWYEERNKQGQEVRDKLKLDLMPISQYQAVRLEPKAQAEISGKGKVTKKMKKEREKQDLEPYKKEMKDFGQWLRNKFLEE